MIVVHNAIINTLRWMSAKKTQTKIEGLRLERKTEQSWRSPSMGLFLCGPEQNVRERAAVVRPQSGKDLQRYCSSDVVS